MGRKLGYALPVKDRYEMTENQKQNEVVGCPNHRDKICILRRLKKKKGSSGLVKSLKSETDDGLSSCSNLPERPTLDEMQSDKPVLPEIEHLRGKLTDEQLEAIKDVLERNEEVFSRHKADIGCCNFVEHEIELEENAIPHREGARRMTPHKSDACRKEIKTLLEYDMIEPSKSPWACGAVMVKKKGDQLRFCCDFRYLNSVTVKDAYPIPRIDKSLSKLGDAKVFTTLNLGSAFWQVPLRKQDRDKTGFACEFGLFQWKRMPFGLCNATASFQRLIAHALIGVTKKYGNLVMCYVDDVVIATPALEDHIERLDEVFACMKRSGLKLQTFKVQDTQRFEKILGQDGGQTRHQTRSRCSRSSSNLEIAKNGTTIDELPGFCKLLQRIHQWLCRQGLADAAVNELQGQEVHVEQRSRRVIPENQERVVRGTSTRDADRERDIRAGYGGTGHRKQRCSQWLPLSRNVEHT